MPRLSALARARADIRATFRKEGRKIYSQSDLASLLSRQRQQWRLPASANISRFIDFLIDNRELTDHDLVAENYGRSTKRYVFGKATAHELALALSPRAYFCHATALHLHGLVSKTDKTLYINIEQSPKPPPSGRLSQRGIDNAFSGKQRQSAMIYKTLDYNTVQLAGKYTNQLGVMELPVQPSGLLRVTGLERTLIDIIVRPTYAGGVNQLLAAYRAAIDRLETEQLAKLLEQLDYRYPYHQAVGFLLQRAGYEETAYAKFRKPTIKHKFYLTHAMEKPAYSPEWRLYYPKDLPC